MSLPRRQVISGGLALAATSVAAVADAKTQAGASPIQAGGGWHEALINVSDLDRTGRFFQTVAGWRPIAQGRLDAATLAYYGASGASGRYRVYRADDHPRGWVRLQEFRGVAQRMIRPHAQPWDTGGIFSVMTRSADVARNLRDAERLGWESYSEPYAFGFGQLQLFNLVLRGPDGVNVAVYEWIAPKRTDVPPGVLSKPFNSMQMVRDLAAARRFYVDQLGFEVFDQGRFIDPEPRATNFALPLNLATQIPRNYVILLPPGADRETGRVELMEFAGFQGRDFSANAGLTQLGVAALRFPVADVDATYARIVQRNGAAEVHAVKPLPLPPFGDARAFTVRSPEGAFVTFFALA